MAGVPAVMSKLTHHGIDIVDSTVDQRIGIIVFGELFLRTPVQKVAATAYQQSGGGNKGGKKIFI